MDETTPHPGRILLDEVMTPLGVSRNQLARDIDVPVGRISAIVSGARAITADTALRLARYFGTTPELWMRLQADYDLARAREQIGAEVEERVRVLQNRAPLADTAPSFADPSPPPETTPVPAELASAPEPAPVEPPPPPAAVAEDPPPAIRLGPAERDEGDGWPAPPEAAEPVTAEPKAGEPEEPPAPPFGPALGPEVAEPDEPNGRPHRGIPAGYFSFDEEPDLPEPEDDVLELSADMMVAEPEKSAKDSASPSSTGVPRAEPASDDAPREAVPAIPEPPRKP